MKLSTPEFEHFEHRLGVQGRLGVSAMLFDSTGTFRSRIDYNADKRFPMASVVKVPIGLALEAKSHRGGISFDETVMIASNTACPGSVANSLDRMYFLPWKSKRSLTIRNLLKLMLAYSDNTASDRILEILGGPQAVRMFLSDIGIEGIEISRSISALLSYYYDLPLSHSKRSGSERWAKLRTILKLLTAYKCRPDKELDLIDACEDTCIPAAMTQLLSKVFGDLQFMQVRQEMKACRTGRARIPEGLKPFGKRIRGVAHKTGTLGGIVNDAGIVELDNEWKVALSIFSCGASVSLASREEVLADVASAIMREFIQ